MHRTQIMLDEDQYQALREQARRLGKSMGQLIRELVAAGLKTTVTDAGRRRSLRSFKGMFSKRDVAGRDHNRHLYGTE